MIKDKVCVAKITTYRNYVQRDSNFKKPVSKAMPLILSVLLRENYQNGGSFIYEINKY